MKLLKEKFIPHKKLKQLFLASSILIISLYIVAMICSLNSSSYFILNYQNTQMDKIEAWFRERSIYSLLMFAFSTLEFYIVLCFILKKKAHWLYPLLFYSIRIGLAFIVRLPSAFNTFYPLPFYILIPLFDQLIENKHSDYHEHFNKKVYGFQMLKLLIAIAVVFILQVMIYVIKAGYFSDSNHVMNLSATFIYALEYDIALLVILFI